MALFYKQSGAWVQIIDAFKKRDGAQIRGKSKWRKEAGVWVPYYLAPLSATVSATTTNLTVSSLFSADDWAAPNPKIVTIAAGVIVGSLSIATAALLTGTGRGGTLEIIVEGEVQGAGGTANSGAGGPAIDIQQTGVTVTVAVGGAVRGGGGGGGTGGAGGTGGIGHYTVSYTAQDGPYYSSGNYGIFPGEDGTGSYWYWNGTVVYSSGIPSSVTVGSYTYYQGSYQGYRTFYGSEGSWNISLYAIYRQYSASYNVNTYGGAGGAGGNGGRGRGYTLAYAAGSLGAYGSAGGTNAGAGGQGGTGGTGGNWGTAGASGSSGNSGAAGNDGSGSGGSAGTAGGAAGAAITGLARTVVNNGTINGAS